MCKFCPNRSNEIDSITYRQAEVVVGTKVEHISWLPIDLDVSTLRGGDDAFLLPGALVLDHRQAVLVHLLGGGPPAGVLLSVLLLLLHQQRRGCPSYRHIRTIKRSIPFTAYRA